MLPRMCNLYNMTTTQKAIIDLARALRDLSGNLEASIDVYPDRLAPIVRTAADGIRELARVRWGLPSSQFALLEAAKKRAAKLEAKGKPYDFAELLRIEPDGGTTNVRRTDSRHWQRWLGVENRCLVPMTSFAEPDPAAKPEGGRTPNAWFALGPDRPLAFFAGIWVPQWTSVRKVKEGLVTADLYGFLTTEPNSVVAPVHQKAMPVILATADEIETWMTAPWPDARALQRPLPDDMLTIVPPPAPVTDVVSPVRGTLI
jgi:putative SOS response-associated peptidase YedK